MEEADARPAPAGRAALRRMSFGTLRITYDEQVLEPRRWTLGQSRWAQEVLPQAPAGTVLELCCGAGQIGLAAIAGTSRQLVAVDRSAHACRYTARNARAAGLGEQVEVRHSALEAALGPDERFALVIADPPWVQAHQVASHPRDPVDAIDGGEDGLDVARTCVALIGRHLVVGGVGLVQLGSQEQARTLLAELPPNVEGGAVRTWPGGGVVVSMMVVADRTPMRAVVS